MSSATTPRFWNLLAFRLTVWYGGILGVAASLCLIISYVVIASAMRSQIDADLLHEATRSMSALGSDDPAAAKHQIDSDTRAIGTNDIFFVLYDRDRRLLASSDLSSWGDIIPAPKEIGQVAIRGKPAYEEAFGKGHHERIRVLTMADSSGNVLRVGFAVEDDQRVINRARRTIGFIMVAAVAVAVVVGWLTARRALAGVQQVASTANAISRGALQRRVPTSGSGNEVDQLASTFNRMLERIASLVKGMEETNDNIAHELRSPIARIRVHAETLLTESSSLDGYRDMAASTVEECDRLLAMINTMLDIAEAESGMMDLNISRVNVNALLGDICELYEPMTAEKDIHVSVEVPEALVMLGDVQKLQRMIANLLDNAVKYTPRGGSIWVRAGLKAGRIEMSVMNTGEGISPEKLPRLFQRFFRADASRSSPGYGLGLSLAQAIVHAHGGQISVGSIPGDKTTFSVSLPVERH